MTKVGAAFDGDDRTAPPLRVGLVNNMPDAAVAITERQFGDLLQAAAPRRTVELKLFEIRQIKRSPEMRARMTGRYHPIEALGEVMPDVLVVTGADPGSSSLREADFWPGFAQLTDWAVEARRPTLWSCLAAHAAVEHLDSIARRLLPAKQSGVFTCATTGADPLLEGLESGWPVPHSRYNGLNEAELIARGYEILTRSDTVGVDAFIRRGPPLFLFQQGHPEYDGDTLALEFRRDFRAYIQGERDGLPEVPTGLFAPEIERQLADLRRSALQSPSPDLMRLWPASHGLGGRPPPWRGAAVRLCANWLNAVL
ncbi:MAG TPA: homoserine O-succinyltransferase [Caulobacteraceae bacterium]|jgi:homoserine O-succinyltransferase